MWIRYARLRIRLRASKSENEFALKRKRLRQRTSSVDIYTKQCSVGVNAIQLALMGATLANNGINPATGEHVIKAEDVPYILSAMTMAGLYDGSGWLGLACGTSCEERRWRRDLSDRSRERGNCRLCTPA